MRLGRAWCLTTAVFVLACVTRPPLHDRSPDPMRVHDAGERRTEAPPSLLDDLGTLSLTRLMERALAASPRLAAARAAATASLHRRAQVTALPDPMLTLGWYAREIETRTGPQRFAIGLRQAIPWPQKLSTAGDLADAEASRRALNTLRTARDLLSEVAISFHELTYIDAARQHYATVQTAYATWLARHAAPEGSDDRTLRARLETRAMEAAYEASLLSELRQVEAERMAALLATTPGDLRAEARPWATPADITDLETLVKVQEERDLEILDARLMLEIRKSEIARAEANFGPDLSVAGRWVVTDERHDADPAGNGNDPLLFELGVTLPLQITARRAAVSEAQWQAESAARSADDLQRRRRAELARERFRAVNAARLQRLHEDHLLPQAREALLLAEQAQRDLGRSFEAVLEATEAVLHFALAAERARADHEQGRVRIAALIGAPLEERP
ncbi:MAG: TolC family protein [Planctomycetes bacterium]|nr:TolC family protein [Planctomycetota bacterium]